MTSRERLLCALDNRQPDRLPVTAHHVLPYFLDEHMGGSSVADFFERFKMDSIVWTVPHLADEAAGTYLAPSQGEPGFLQSRRVVSNHWKIEEVPITGEEYPTTGMRFHTPKGTLSMELQSNEYTTWVSEYLIKEKSDIELIGEFATAPVCDIEAVNKTAEALGERGIVRGHVCCFEGFGQPGCWQDAACLMGIEPLIMATFDDPDWVHEFLAVLQKRKLSYIQSMKGARYDVIELGGGDASSTVISPTLFDEFVAPYDAPLIEAAHEAGQRIAYHTCGGMMPILEQIADMNPDAMETFTPPGMGADVDLAEAKRRIGDRVCMIGGFDQGRFFKRATPEEVRAEVRRRFKAAGEGGGYILCPSDHFFDAEPELLTAFADAARDCRY